MIAILPLFEYRKKAGTIASTVLGNPLYQSLARKTAEDRVADIKGEEKKSAVGRHIATGAATLVPGVANLTGYLQAKKRYQKEEELDKLTDKLRKK